MNGMANIPTLASMNCSWRFFSLESFFLASHEAGYDACEIWTGPMHFFMDSHEHDPVDRLKTLERRYGMKVIGICPEQTNPKPHNMAARDPRMQERTYAYFRNAIDVACEIGASQVVATSGWGYLDEPRRSAWERSVRMLGRVGDYAAERGTLVAIEALQPAETNLVHTVSELVQLIDEAGSPALKVCLDIGAMWAAGETIDDYFDAFGSDVVHCHFVDCGEQSHVSWGTGSRDMARDLERLMTHGYRGSLSVETLESAHLANPAAADLQAISLYRSAVKEVTS